MGVLSVSVATGTVLAEGVPADFPYIDSLRKREGDALGFLPKERYLAVLERREGRSRPGRVDWLHEKVLVTLDNGDHTGFVNVRFGPVTRTASITQIAIQDDARRWHRALLMLDWIEAEAVRRGCERVSARVAADLESNHFWAATGYKVWKQTPSSWQNRGGSRSGRLLLVYVKHLALPWQMALEMA